MTLAPRQPGLRPASARGVMLASLCAVAAVLAPATTALAAPPSITAPAAAVIETSTGTVVYQKNGYVPHGMASTTKLMTALVALDEVPLKTVYPAVNYRAGAAETKMNLVPGERLTVADYLRGMMLPSANDAAQTIAVRVGGSKAKFVAMMNEKAESLGLTHTHFTNPVGLDSPTHRTTALDLARIGVAAHNNPFLKATVKRSRITLQSGDSERTLINRNAVLGDKLGGGAVIDGMKTGHTTAAGYSLVGSATAGDVSFVSVVLGEPSEAARDADTVKLLRWATPLLQERQIVEKDQRAATVPVTSGKEESVAAVTSKDLERVVPKNATVQLVATSMSPALEAPVAAGTKVGVAKVLVNGKQVDTVALVTGTAVERQGAVAAAFASIGDHWKETILALLLVIGGTLTVVRSRQPARPAPHPRAPAPQEPTERTTAP